MSGSARPRPCSPCRTRGRARDGPPAYCAITTNPTLTIVARVTTTVSHKITRVNFSTRGNPLLSSISQFVQVVCGADLRLLGQLIVFSNEFVI